MQRGGKGGGGEERGCLSVAHNIKSFFFKGRVTRNAVRSKSKLSKQIYTGDGGECLMVSDNQSDAFPGTFTVEGGGGGVSRIR